MNTAIDDAQSSIGGIINLVGFPGVIDPTLSLLLRHNGAVVAPAYSMPYCWALTGEEIADIKLTDRSINQRRRGSA